MFSSELSYQATACSQVPAFKKRGCAKPITQLPVKVIINPQQRLNFSIGVKDVVLKPLSPQMHMRKEAEQRGIVGQGASNIHPIIVSMAEE